MFSVIKPFLGFPREDPYAHRTSVFKMVPTLVTTALIFTTFVIVKPYVKSAFESEEKETTELEKLSGDLVRVDKVGLMHKDQIAAG
jgi:hypothetical protein